MQDFALRVYEPILSGIASGLTSSEKSGSIILPPFKQDVTADLVEGFPRSIGKSGPDKGVFTLESEDASSLFQIFDDWIGGHCVEWTAGDITWEGYIYMMDIIHKGDRDRRAIIGVPTDEQVWNAVSAIYVALGIEDSDELAANASFEVAGAGGGDVFDSWQEAAGSGTITQDAAVFHTGAFSANLTRVGVQSPNITQYYSLREGSSYRLSFYARGDGTVDGRYFVYDVEGAAFIVATTNTGITGTTFTVITLDFTVPAGCRTVQVVLTGPTAVGSAYFDTVSLKEIKNVTYETEWATADKSIARFGRKEIKIDVGVTSLTNAMKQRDLYLSQRAWPWARPVATAEEKANDPITRLEIYVCGYVYTLNYQYVEELAASVTSDDAIAEILGTCEFVTAINMAAGLTADMLSVDRLTDGQMIKERAGTAILRLVEQGDTPGNPFVFYVLPGRKAVYGRRDLNPKYYRRNGLYSTNIGGTVELHPRQHWPGVVRRMDHPVSGREYGSLLLDRRDMMINEFHVDEKGNVAGRVDTYAESEVLRIQDSRRPEKKPAPPIGTDGGQEWLAKSWEMPTPGGGGNGSGGHHVPAPGGGGGHGGFPLGGRDGDYGGHENLSALIQMIENLGL